MCLHIVDVRKLSVGRDQTHGDRPGRSSTRYAEFQTADLLPLFHMNNLHLLQLTHTWIEHSWIRCHGVDSLLVVVNQNVIARRDMLKHEFRFLQVLRFRPSERTAVAPVSARPVQFHGCIRQGIAIWPDYLPANSASRQHLHVVFVASILRQIDGWHWFTENRLSNLKVLRQVGFHAILASRNPKKRIIAVGVGLCLQRILIRPQNHPCISDGFSVVIIAHRTIRLLHALHRPVQRCHWLMITHRPQHRQLLLCKLHWPRFATDRRHQSPIVAPIRKDQVLLAFLKVVTAVAASPPRENIYIGRLRARNLFIDSKVIVGIPALIDGTHVHTGFWNLVKIRRRILNSLYRTHKHSAGRTKLSAGHRSWSRAAASQHNAPPESHPKQKKNRGSEYHCCFLSSSGVADWPAILDTPGGRRGSSCLCSCWLSVGKQVELTVKNRRFSQPRRLVPCVDRTDRFPDAYP